MDRENLIKLAKATGKAYITPAQSFSLGEETLKFSALNETLRGELDKLSETYRDYRENKDLIFSLVEVAIDEIMPQKVLQSYQQFADIKVVKQGEKAVFTVRISEAAKQRAKQFVTKVGLAGSYEVFQLDGYSFTVPTSAYGGAAQISIEAFLDKQITMADVFDLVLEGLDEAIYREIAKALKSMVENLQNENKVIDNSFDEALMDRLIGIADGYGHSTIYCTYEFATQMLPPEGWVSDEMRNQRWNTGHLGNYKGHSVIILPQSYEDTTHTKKVIDPSLAYILPNGAEKPVKVVFEGPTLTKEVEGEDWSKTIKTYKKVGIASYLVNPGICTYQNTSLAQQ